MNNQTESLKRSMYDCLARIKAHSDRQIKHRVLLEFEERLEEYLEAMRKDSAALLAITGDEMRAFQQAARTDREDTVRAVAQADALSDQLSEAHRTICSQGSKIQAQQLAIGDLYMRAIF